MTLIQSANGSGCLLNKSSDWWSCLFGKVAASGTRSCAVNSRVVTSSGTRDVVCLCLGSTSVGAV